MNIRRLTYSLPLVLIVILVSFYQNCSDVQLQKPIQEVAVSSTSITGNVCAPEGQSVYNHQNFIFVVDMSLSNIGGASTSATHAFCFSNANATDRQQRRFQAIQTFINACTAAQGASYSIMGFSKSSLFGIQNGSQFLNCNSSMASDTATTTQRLSWLAGIQTRDQNLAGAHYCWDGIYPFIMEQTYYSEAFKCMDQQIASDLGTHVNDPSNYQVFFMTDGQPFEPNFTCAAGDTVCANMFASCNTGTQEQRQQCRMQILASQYYPYLLQNTVHRVSGANVSLRMQPLYYGSDSEYANAKAVLDAMAQIMDPSATTMKIDNIETLATNLCQSLRSESETAFQIQSFQVYDLTSLAVGNQLLADSDMDGLADIQETDYGFQPLQARSSGILDGLCAKKGASNCFVSANCQNQAFGFLLSQCEQNSSYLPALTGLDSDRDFLLDVIEILKGTSSLQSNSSTSDQDGDGRTDLYEITHGQDPSLTADLQQNLKLSYSFQESTRSGLCSGKSYRFQMSKLPMVTGIQAYVDPLHPAGDAMSLSHDANEHVLLLTYVAKPMGSTSSTKRYYAKILKVRPNQNMSIEFQPNDFQFIGEQP